MPRRGTNASDLVYRNVSYLTASLDLKSVNGIMKKLLYITPNRKLLYVTDTRDGYITHRMEHLACFLPGVLALGAHTLDLSPRDKELHQWAALGLAYTCWVSYADQLSGLGPDQLQMVAGGEKWLDHIEQWEASGREGGIPPGSREVEAAGNGPRDYINSQDIYLLRPEVSPSRCLASRLPTDPRSLADGRKSLYHVEDNRRPTMERTWIFYLHRAGKSRQDPVRLL